MTKTRRIREISLSCVISFFVLCLVVHPQKYIASVYNGLLLFATSVAPALFPFFFFTKLLTALGSAAYLGAALSKPMKRLYRAHASGGYIYVMSILSGYPVGSRLIADLYARGVLDTEDAARISSFTSTSGPLFIVGTVATMMMRSPAAGYVIMACHFAGALLNGFLYRGRDKASDKAEKFSLPGQEDDILGGSMKSSILSILIVGGYIAIFSMVIDVLDDIGFFSMLETPLSLLLRLCRLPEECARGVLVSFVEITRGCQEFATCGLPLKKVIPFVAGMLSFGGLSISCQSMTFLAQCRVKFSYFALTKTTQALITFSLALLVCAF